MGAKTLKTLDDLFEIAGGTVQLAALLDKNQWVVERWAKTGVPFKHWKKLIKEFGNVGLDVHALSAMSQAALDRNAK